MDEMRMNAQETIKVREKFCYGCGDLASNLVSVLATAYISFFYTDALGLNIGIVSMIIMVSRLFDGITDVLMGFLIDKTKSKHGKARAWLLWLAVPFGISTILMMLVPRSWGDIGKYIYVFITYNLTVTFLYTAINIPYGTLNSLMTRDQHQRESINLWRMTMASIGGMIINALTLPLVNQVGGSTDQRSWIIVSCIYGIMAALLFLLCFFNTKERVTVTHSENSSMSFGKTMKVLFKNKYWVFICLVYLAFAFGGGMAGSAGTYYYKYIVGDENQVGYVGVINSIAIMITMVLLTKPIKKYGKRNVASFGSIIYIIFQVVMYAAPTSFIWLMVCSAARGVGMACVTGTIFAMIADSIEYGNWKSGYRIEGPLYSATTFGAKVGGGVGVALGGMILSNAGYDGALAVQSAGALSSMKTLYILMPAIFIAIVPVILYFYKLDKEYPMIMKELEEREMLKTMDGGKEDVEKI